MPRAVLLWIVSVLFTGWDYLSLELIVPARRSHGRIRIACGFVESPAKRDGWLEFNSLWGNCQLGKDSGSIKNQELDR